MHTSAKHPADRKYARAAVGFALLSGLLFAFPLAMGACGKSGSSSTALPIGVGASCTADGDCNPGLECEHNICQPRDDGDDNEQENDAGPACTVNADCPPGQECDDGQCENEEVPEHGDAGPACTVDTDCPPGQECDDGQCKVEEEQRDAGVACHVDADCGAGQQCDDGVCKAHGDDGSGGH